MQDKTIKKVLIRVAVVLTLVVIVAVILIPLLNKKSAEVEKTVGTQMAADIVQAVTDAAEDGTGALEETGGAQDETSGTRPEPEDDMSEGSTEEQMSADAAADQRTTEEENETKTEEASAKETETDDEQGAQESTGEPEQPQEGGGAPKESEEAVPTVSAAAASAPVVTTAPAPAATATPTPAPTPTPVPTATPAPEPTVPAASVPIDYTEDRTYVSEAQAQMFKNRLLENINNLRASKGLGALTMDACLVSGASVRANESSVKWSHTRPNGEQGLWVLAGCGGYYADAVNCIRNNIPSNYALGENLAVAYSWSNYTGTDQEILDLADETFLMWVNSQSHYDNLVKAAYTKIGLGLYVNMDEEIYHAFWTCALFSD